MRKGGGTVEELKPSCNFIETISKESPEYQRVIESIVKSKNGKRESKKDIAAITKEILNSDAVVFEDGSSVTFGEAMVAGIIANQFNNKQASFKDLGELQKVIGETTESEKGVVINVITNGQDLGD